MAGVAPILDPADLDFGALAAERDTVAALRAYFVESEAYVNLRDGAKWVALGTRGSGKSAILRMLAEHERGKGGLVIELSPDEYSYELLSRTMVPEDRGSWAKQGAYSAAWKYLIYVIVMKAMNRAGSNYKGGLEGSIYNYLRDRHKGTPTNPIGMLISYLKRLEGVKVGKWEAGMKSRELTQLYHLEEIAPLLDAVDALAEKNRVTVLIDELDRGWDGSEDAKAFVAGLFTAAIGISARTPHVRIRIALRRELYTSIPALYEDAQKVRDIIQVVEWDEPGLQDLIARRISHAYPSLEGQSVDSRWNGIFQEVLAYRKTKSVNYILDRTLYRPRQTIQFCKLAAEQLRKKEAGLPMDYGTISEAEQAYSEEMTNDIASEYKFQWPGLRSLFETFRGSVYSIERADLEYHLFRVSLGDLRVDNEASEWCSEQDPQVLLNVLWDVGFLQAYAVGGLKARRRSGSEYIGAHQVSSLSLVNITRFHIHPMFRSSLGCKEPRN